MLKLYSAPRTRSIRVAWLMEEMGIDYEIVTGTFQQTPTTFYIQDTPTGKYPTIDDDGFIMFESVAIAEYLLEKYGDRGLMPLPGDPERGEFLQWMHFADATAFAPLGIVIWLSVYRDDAAEHGELIRAAATRARSGFQYLEEQLGGRTWLIGEQFSAADIMMAFTLQAAKLLGLLTEFPVLLDYLVRLQARPAFKIAAEKTGNTDFS